MTMRIHALGLCATVGMAMAGAPDAVRAEGEDDRIAVAVTQMVTRGPIDRTEVEGLELVLAASLQKEPRVRAIMPSEIQTLLGLEAQKQLLGCDVDSSCLAEIGGALGAPYVLSSQVSRVGSTWLLQLSLLDAAKSETLHRATREVAGIDPLVSAIKETVVEILSRMPELGNVTGPVAGAASTDPIPSVAPRNKKSKTLFWIGLGGGLALMGAGSGMLVSGQTAIRRHNVASWRLEEISTEDPHDDLMDLKQARKVTSLRNGGIVAAGLGAALIALDLALLSGRGDKGASVALMPLPDGAYAIARWRLP